MGNEWRPRVGEFVVCSGVASHDYCKVGKVYKITEIHKNYYDSFRVNGFTGWWFNASTFIPLNEILKEE